MIRNSEEAHAHLADALWWLRGFSAATAPGQDNESGPLAEKLREVREYLARISEGKVRRIGNEAAVVLTYAEFERLYDACRDGAALADVGHARAVIAHVSEEYFREAKAARDFDEIPF